MKLFALLGLLLTLVPASASAASEERSLSRTLGDWKVTVTAGPRNKRKGSVALAGKRGYYGMDGGLPSEVVRRVAILIGPKRFMLPRELYADLGEPRLLSSSPEVLTLTRQGGFLAGELRGGDGAGTWHCRWRIDLVRLEVARAIWQPLGTWPDYGVALPLVPRRAA